MIAKKNPKYDLERRRKLYLNLGFLVAGSLTLAAFEYGTPISDHQYQLQEKRLASHEIFEVKEKPIVERLVSSQKPNVLNIRDEERQREVDEDPDEQVVTAHELPDFKDFTTGEKGMGDYGLTDPDPIQTMGIEFVEQYPVFPGGDPAMTSFIQGNFKFPRQNFSNDQGTIYVRFVVSHKGEIHDAAIERGLSPDLDREAIRVVRSMPNWEPGKHRGRPVNVRMIIPIRVRYQ